MNVLAPPAISPALVSRLPDVWLVLLGELAIGIGLIFGIATRYVALFTFVFLIMTIVLGHRYWAFRRPNRPTAVCAFPARTSP